MHTMTREADEHTRIRAEKEVEKHAHAQEGAEVKRRQNLSMRALLAKVHRERQARSLVRQEREEARAREHARIRAYKILYCDRSKYHIGN